MAKWLELDRKLYGLQEDSNSDGGHDENWKKMSEGERSKENRKKEKYAQRMKWENLKEIVCQTTKSTSSISQFRIDKM